MYESVGDKISKIDRISAVNFFFNNNNYRLLYETLIVLTNLLTSQHIYSREQKSSSLSPSSWSHTEQETSSKHTNILLLVPHKQTKDTVCVPVKSLFSGRRYYNRPLSSSHLSRLYSLPCRLCKTSRPLLGFQGIPRESLRQSLIQEAPQDNQDN